jgi:hypothetical protein
MLATEILLQRQNMLEASLKNSTNFFVGLCLWHILQVSVNIVGLLRKGKKKKKKMS